MIRQRKGGGFFTESDASLSGKFREAGFGFPEGGALLLHPLEAAYLVRMGKAAFEKATLQHFVSSQKKKDKLFPFAFAVYSKIRATGRIVRPFMEQTPHFRVYAPGIGREDDRPSQLVFLLPGNPPSPKTIAGQVKIAHLARLDLVIACGTEREIRFYKVASYNF